MTTIRLASFALGLLLTAGGVSAASAQGCASRGEARQLVAEGQVAPLPVALQRAGLGDAQVISADLCQSGGGWSYNVQYRQDGEVRSANIPAG